MSLKRVTARWAIFTAYSISSNDTWRYTCKNNGGTPAFPIGTQPCMKIHENTCTMLMSTQARSNVDMLRLLTRVARSPISCQLTSYESYARSTINSFKFCSTRCQSTLFLHVCTYTCYGPLRISRCLVLSSIQAHFYHKNLASKVYVSVCPVQITSINIIISFRFTSKFKFNFNQNNLILIWMFSTPNKIIATLLYGNIISLVKRACIVHLENILAIYGHMKSLDAKPVKSIFSV